MLCVLCLQCASADAPLPAVCTAPPADSQCEPYVDGTCAAIFSEVRSAEDTTAGYLASLLAQIAYDNMADNRSVPGLQSMPTAAPAARSLAQGGAPWPVCSRASFSSFAARGRIPLMHCCAPGAAPPTTSSLST